ncbi:MAG: nuclear transport factor 2 family protein [Pseudomonadota bacterium]
MGRVFAVVLAVIALSLPARADDNLAAMEAIDNIVSQLDEAFETGDADTIKKYMTPDHVSVTPMAAGPQSFEDLIATLPDLKMKQTNLSEPTVVFLGPETAMRTVTAKLEGAFKGKAFDTKVFATAILVKKDGKWLERFYQATSLAP